MIVLDIANVNVKKQKHRHQQRDEQFITMKCKGFKKDRRSLTNDKIDEVAGKQSKVLIVHYLHFANNLLLVDCIDFIMMVVSCSTHQLPIVLVLFVLNSVSVGGSCD